jgi:DNA polymerase elongation subunit (family B)
MKDNKLSPDEELIYDSKQLSIKVVCNSFYGILGAQGILFCP